MFNTLISNIQYSISTLYVPLSDQIQAKFQIRIQAKVPDPCGSGSATLTYSATIFQYFVEKVINPLNIKTDHLHYQEKEKIDRFGGGKYGRLINNIKMLPVH